MKILVISELYPPYYLGGYEINCKDTVDALIDRGHQVTLLTSFWGIPEKSIQGNIYRILDFDRIDLGDGINRNSKKISNLEKRILEYKRRYISRRNYSITKTIISKIQPDIVYLWRLQITTTSPALCAQDMGIPTVFRIEDYWLARIRLTLNEKTSPVKRLYYSLILEKRQIERLRLNNLLIISQSLKNYYINAGFPEDSMKVLPCGLSSDRFRNPADHSYRPFSPQDGTVRLAFIGRLEDQKGPDIAIESIARLGDISHPLLHLDIIGTGNQGYLEYLKQLVARLHIQNKVSFLGKLEQDEIVRRFQDYDALLFTSRWQEPFGRIIIEAMAYGLPVIAAQTGGVAEIITNLENGLLVPADNPGAMSEAIRKLLQDPNFAEKLSRNAFATVQSKFSLKQLATRLEMYISAIL